MISLAISDFDLKGRNRGRELATTRSPKVSPERRSQCETSSSTAAYAQAIRTEQTT